ncbi:MAG: hypothetical protein LOD87_04700, partial [Planifilum fulgidum]
EGLCHNSWVRVSQKWNRPSPLIQNEKRADFKIRAGLKWLYPLLEMKKLLSNSQAEDIRPCGMRR